MTQIVGLSRHGADKFSFLLLLLLLPKASLPSPTPAIAKTQEEFRRLDRHYPDLTRGENQKKVQTKHMWKKT